MPEAATPRPASTVAILRDGTTGIDVWLMRRHSAMAFAAGMQAFPGGALEAADDDPSLPWSGPSPDRLGAVFGVAPGFARALVSAAVRETFEECGVLFATGELPSADALETARLAVLDGELSWHAFLAGSGLALDAGALVPWARWITPDWSPRRFDAYFFLARLADGAEPRHIDGEADRAGWVSVGGAIAAHEAGELPMLPPTITTLRQLVIHPTVDAALAAHPRHVTEEDG